MFSVSEQLERTCRNKAKIRSQDTGFGFLIISGIDASLSDTRVAERIELEGVFEEVTVGLDRESEHRDVAAFREEMAVFGAEIIKHNLSQQVA